MASLQKLSRRADAAAPTAPGGWNAGRETRKQLRRFLVVGSTSVAVDFIVYHLLAVAMPPDVAKGISYLAGVVVGFFGNKWWTFESRGRSAAEPLVYLALYAATLGVNVACNRAALAVLSALAVRGSTATGFAFLFATGVTTILNFLGMKTIAFRRGIAERREIEVRKAA